MANEPPATRPLMLAMIAQRDALMAYVERQIPPTLRGVVDAADVVQDVCYDALRRETAFDPKQDPTGRRWLFTIAKRRLVRLAEQRREVNEAAIFADADDPLVRLLGEVAVYERTPSQSAASHETWVAISQSLNRLPDDHAAVIRSRYIDRLPAAAVAQRTGRTPASVNQMLHRAMAALRLELRSLIAAHA